MERWLRCWGVVAALGVGASVFVWDPILIVVLWLSATFCAGLVMVLLTTTPGVSGFAAGTTWARILTHAALAGAGVVAVCAVGALSAALGVTLALSAVLTLPAVASRASRLVRHDTPDLPPLDSRIVVTFEQTRPLPRVLPEAAVRQLSNQELCLEWRRSFTALQLATGPTDRMRVVEVRQLYLDEMERRSPAALQAWLGSGARAAGGPERFLRQHPEGPGSRTA